jgi:hypothetical protein
VVGDFYEKLIKTHEASTLWKSNFNFDRDGTKIYIDMDKVEKLVIFEE